MRVSIARIALSVALWLAGLPPAGAAANDWEVIAERDGIVVSSRQVAGRELPQLRSVGEVAGTPYEVLAVLLDVPGYVDWLPDCVEARTVRRIGPWRSLIYTRTDVPVPVADRDVVVLNTVEFVEPPRRVRMSFQAVPAPRVARVHGVVRMTQATGSYAIEAIDATRSRVQYEIDADPAGAVPDWLIASQSTRNPLETLAGLRRRLEETRGQYDEFITRFPSGADAAH